MGFSIRAVQEQDAESIVELLKPILSEEIYTAMDQELSINDQISFIREFPDRGVFHVAVCDDSQKVVGIQDVLPVSKTTKAFSHVGEISTFVLLDLHRRGIGRMLSDATFKMAKVQGFRKIMATIRADNPNAVNFYQSQGFKIIGTAKQHVFINGRYIDEVLSEKLLTENN